MSESNDVEQQVFWRKNNPIAYGIAISTIVLIGYSVVGFRTECIGSFCENNFQKFWDAKPNEVGDTLAGLFGALAFVWIIVTVFLQSQELREQRKEFREQRLATQDLARSSAAQARIFEHEQKEREQRSANDELMALVQEAVMFNDRILKFQAIWFKHRAHDPYGNESEDSQRLAAYFSNDLNWEDSFYQVVAQVTRNANSLCDTEYYKEAKDKPSRQVVHQFSSILDKIYSLGPKSSPATQSFLRRTDFDAVIPAIADLLSREDAWEIET